MNLLFVLLALASSPEVSADQLALAKDVDVFVAERELCEHFLGEPAEGSSPEQIERREFVQDSIDIHCAGTDRRLAALRRRFKNDPAVIARLKGYDASVEASCERP